MESFGFFNSNSNHFIQINYNSDKKIELFSLPATGLADRIIFRKTLSYDLIVFEFKLFSVVPPQIQLNSLSLNFFKMLSNFLKFKVTNLSFSSFKFRNQCQHITSIGNLIRSKKILQLNRRTCWTRWLNRLLGCPFSYSRSQLKRCSTCARNP